MSLFLDGRFPLQCGTCKGEGEIPELTCHHDGARCGCARDWRVCPSCLGTGTIICRICGEHESTGTDADGWEACPLCLAAEKDEAATHAEEPTRRVRALS